MKTYDMIDSILFLKKSCAANSNVYSTFNNSENTLPSNVCKTQLFSIAIFFQN
jgi:hypothetical protein